MVQKLFRNSTVAEWNSATDSSRFPAWKQELLSPQGHSQMQPLVLRPLGKNTGETTEWKRPFQKLDLKARIQGRTWGSRKQIKVAAAQGSSHFYGKLPLNYTVKM